MAPRAVDELERQVLEGGRFVVFQFCVSIVVISFRRSSPVIFLRANDSGTGPALGYSAISFFAGWWGIPWGPIWTVTFLANNLTGGKDITHAVLAEKRGPARASQIMAARRRGPAEGSLKALWLGLGGAAALFAILVLGLFAMANIGNHRQMQAGEGRFQAANQQLDMYRGRVGFGNSPKAVAVAQRFSTNMKVLRETMFEGGKPNGLSLSHHEFLTYCELQNDKCALIVHVPELRRYTDSAKRSIGELAWLTARETLKTEGAGKPGMKVAIGLRGMTVYDRVMMGAYDADAFVSTNMPSETITGLHAEGRLFPWFETVSAASPANLPTGTNDLRATAAESN